MKKILATIIAAIVLTNIAFADVPTVRLTTIHKEGGRGMLFGLCETRYDLVDKFTEIKYVMNPYTGESYEIIYTTLRCVGKGWSKCRLSVAEKSFNYNGVNISERVFDENTNSLMDQVDKNLEQGVYSGKTSKKVAVKASGKQFLFLFEATWKNGNDNGDADIEIKVSDITAYSSVIAGSANGAAVSIK